MVTALAEVKREPNQEVVQQLENMLALARNGDLIGFVAFSFHAANRSGSGQAGDTDFSAILAAFEDWKFRRVWGRTRTDEAVER